MQSCCVGLVDIFILNSLYSWYSIPIHPIKKKIESDSVSESLALPLWTRFDKNSLLGTLHKFLRTWKSLYLAKLIGIGPPKVFTRKLWWLPWNGLRLLCNDRRWPWTISYVSVCNLHFVRLKTNSRTGWVGMGLFALKKAFKYEVYTINLNCGQSITWKGEGLTLAWRKLQVTQMAD